MVNFKITATMLSFFISTELASANVLAEFPDSKTIWIPITLNIEIDSLRLKFGAPHLRQNAIKNLGITEIIEQNYQGKKDCEHALMDMCKADHCDVETLSVGNTDQFVFRSSFPKIESGSKTNFAIFAFCRPYKVFFSNDAEFFQTGF